MTLAGHWCVVRGLHIVMTVAGRHRRGDAEEGIGGAFLCGVCCQSSRVAGEATSKIPATIDRGTYPAYQQQIPPLFPEETGQSRRGRKHAWTKYHINLVGIALPWAMPA